MSVQEIMFGSIGRNIDQVIEENLDALVRFAYFRISDRAEAEDVVYEAVLRLLEKREMVNDARCYLFRIVYNLCQDRFRKNRFQQSLSKPLIWPMKRITGLTKKKLTVSIACWMACRPVRPRL